MTDYQKTTWRLIKTPPAVGPWNMAVDEAILESVRNSSSPPTLRLYAWNPPCISIGYAQSISDVDMDALVKYNWMCVRRTTGGRAILHTDELTYAVIGPQSDPRLAGGVLESYRKLSQALLRALELMSIPAVASHKTDRLSGNPHTQDSGITRSSNPVCFEVPSNYEITVEGKKLIGSAQARRKGGVLQHGSLPLDGDLTRITRALVFPSDNERAAAAARLLDRATTVENVMGHPVPWDIAAGAFCEAFEDTLNLDLQQASLTRLELKRGEDIMDEKYTHTNWTNRI